MTTGPDDDDFGALFEASLARKRRTLNVGEKVRGTVIQVGREQLVLDLGDGQDALLPIAQFALAAQAKDDAPSGGTDVREGDSLEAWVVGFAEGVPELALQPGRGGNRVGLEDALRTGLPVSGIVTDVNKGGFVVDLAGTRAFCPLGAMDLRRIEEPAQFVGQRLQFRVTEMKGPRDVVVSRRVLLAEENARRADETRGRVVPGARLSGTVTNVRDFGAFVDVGGIEGMVPAGEMAYGRVTPKDVVAVGGKVDVEVLRVEKGEDGKERITLSMKALLDDPFADAVADLKPGTVVLGTVTRVQPFGAFVELLPGVEGLVHVSAFGKRIGHPSEMVRPAQDVAVRVDGVDAGARRISLALVDQAMAQDPPPAVAGRPRILRMPEPKIERPAASSSEPAVARESFAAPRIGDIVDVVVDKAETFGIFVSWPAGRGLVPGRELGLPRTADLRRQFPPGTKLKAAVIDVRDDGKITLSTTAVDRVEERAATEAYMKRAGQPEGRGLGSLGDVLRAQLERKR